MAVDKQEADVEIEILKVDDDRICIETVMNNGAAYLLGEDVRNASRPGEEEIQLIDCDEMPKRPGLLESEI